MKVWFSKYEALGNDFIILDLRFPQGGENFSPEKFAEKYCRRRFGIGADGVIVIEKPSSEEYDFRMRVINQDGTEAEMSGNGIRCAAKYIYDAGLKSDGAVVFETKAGKRTVRKTPQGFEVFMGTPEVIEEFEIREGENWGDKFRCVRVDVGNPHIVVFAEGVKREVFLALAGNISKAENSNVHFVYRVDKDGVRAWVWERGVGETLACGTGAVAIFKACESKGLVKGKTQIIFPGGELSVKAKDREVFIEGDANFVFSGYIDV